MKHLKARRQNLQGLFEKRKKTELGSTPSAETETGKGKEEPQEGPGKRPAQQTREVGPAFDATPLLPTIHREAARVATFQNDPARLIEAFLVALVEMGLCKSAQDLQTVTDALIRVSQRKR